MFGFFDIHERIPVVSVWCSDSHLNIQLEDGREAAVPLWHYPRLLRGTPVQRENFKLTVFGIHWPDLDEDLSIRGILEGRKAAGAVPPVS